LENIYNIQRKSRFLKHDHIFNKSHSALRR